MSGQSLREVSDDLRNKILRRYYRPHHMALDRVVKSHLQNYSKALVLDCHSYPDTPLPYDIDQRPNRPDFNIGTDDFHTPSYLIEVSREYFESVGYSLGVDWSYSGSIVPMHYFQKNQKVTSIMLEVNRKSYLEEGTAQKSDNYHETKKVIAGFIDIVSKESV